MEMGPTRTAFKNRILKLEFLWKSSIVEGILSYRMMVLDQV